MTEDVILCWSGGKDSALALDRLRQSGRYHVAALLTTVTEDYDRVSMHGVRRVLVERQAAALRLSLQQVRIPAGCVNAHYEERMGTAMAHAHSQGIERVAFGDIFLEDVRQYREANLARAGMQGVFPLWKLPSAELAREFLRLGFQAIVVVVDPSKLDRSFAGRAFDQSFLRDIPAGVDPCGENGEFHTFVWDGPGFRAPVTFRVGEVVLRDAFYFCDLLPA